MWRPCSSPDHSSRKTDTVPRKPNQDPSPSLITRPCILHPPCCMCARVRPSDRSCETKSVSMMNRAGAEAGNPRGKSAAPIAAPFSSRSPNTHSSTNATSSMKYGETCARLQQRQSAVKAHRASSKISPQIDHRSPHPAVPLRRPPRDLQSSVTKVCQHLAANKACGRATTGCCAPWQLLLDEN